MEKKEKYEHWLKIARYDLDTAEAMFKSGRYLYVAFTCQQAIEKLAKGIYVYSFNKEAKYTHNITLVLSELETITNSADYAKYKTFLDDLSSYYISGRYDVYKNELAQSFNKDRAKNLLAKTKEAFAWLQSQVKQ